VVKSTAASEEIEWSPSIQTILDHPPALFPRQLIFGGTLFFLAFAAWAYFGQIDEVGQAKGQLIPRGDIYKIHPVELGKVTRIAVKEGQRVKAGQLLAELDTQTADGDVSRLRQAIAAEQVQLSQMELLVSRLQLDARSRGEISQADAEAQQAAIAEAKAKAASFQDSLTQLNTDAAAHQTRLDRLKPLVGDGAISQERLFEVEQALRDRQNTITRTQGDLAQTQAEISRLQAGLSQKRAEGGKTQLEVQQQAQQLEVQITQLKAKIAETQNLLATANIKRKQNLLVSPIAGTVSTLNIRNPGEVLQPGQTVAEVAAQNAPLTLRAKLPNHEAGFVKVGMPVQVKLDAYPYQEYGVIPGKVLAISSDAKPNNQTDPIYQVDISLDRNQITAHQQTIQFKTGQAATADIIIRRRRIIDVLFDPIRQLQKGGISL
jgi:hemolysin D